MIHECYNLLLASTGFSLGRVFTLPLLPSSIGIIDGPEEETSRSGPGEALGDDASLSEVELDALFSFTVGNTSLSAPERGSFTAAGEGEISISWSTGKQKVSARALVITLEEDQYLVDPEYQHPLMTQQPAKGHHLP